MNAEPGSATERMLRTLRSRYANQMEIQMKTLFLHILFAGACIAPVAASASEVVPSNNASDIAAIKQISRDMGDAMVSGDIATLDRMFADDWVSVASSGKVAT